MQAKETDKMRPWYWLHDNERAVLLQFNPKAEEIINAGFPYTDFTQTNYRPWRGGGKPHVAEKHIVVKEHTGWMVEIHHPFDSSFTKHEMRDCMAVIERSTYMLNFDKLVMAVMQPELLKRLHWNIYAPSHNELTSEHIYLVCDSMKGGPGSPSLYVPVTYFYTGEWQEVAELHERVAVGYYKGTGFGASQNETLKWQEQTRALLTSIEAKVLRTIIES